MKGKKKLFESTDCFRRCEWMHFSVHIHVYRVWHNVVYSSRTMNSENIFTTHNGSCIWLTGTYESFIYIYIYVHVHIYPHIVCREKVAVHSSLLVRGETEWKWKQFNICHFNGMHTAYKFGHETMQRNVIRSIAYCSFY